MSEEVKEVTEEAKAPTVIIEVEGEGDLKISGNVPQNIAEAIIVEAAQAILSEFYEAKAQEEEPSDDAVQ